MKSARAGGENSYLCLFVSAATPPNCFFFHTEVGWVCFFFPFGFGFGFGFVVAVFGFVEVGGARDTVS